MCKRQHFRSVGWCPKCKAQGHVDHTFTYCRRPLNSNKCPTLEGGGQRVEEDINLSTGREGYMLVPCNTCVQDMERRGIGPYSDDGHLHKLLAVAASGRAQAQRQSEASCADTTDSLVAGPQRSDTSAAVSAIPGSRFGPSEVSTISRTETSATSRTQGVESDDDSDDSNNSDGGVQLPASVSQVSHESTSTEGGVRLPPSISQVSHESLSEEDVSSHAAEPPRYRSPGPSPEDSEMARQHRHQDLDERESRLREREARHEQWLNERYINPRPRSSDHGTDNVDWRAVDRYYDEIRARDRPPSGFRYVQGLPPRRRGGRSGGH